MIPAELDAIRTLVAEWTCGRCDACDPPIIGGPWPCIDPLLHAVRVLLAENDELQTRINKALDVHAPGRTGSQHEWIAILRGEM